MTEPRSTIDYRIDDNKLEWSVGPPGKPCPPVQCYAFQERQKRRSLWDRLTRFLFRPTGADLMAEYYAGRCQMFLGHWVYESQREHINGWDERWPVSEADTKPFNPAEPPAA